MRLFKRMMAVMLVLMMVLSLTACGRGKDSSRSINAKTYIIATDTKFAPFEYQNGAGEYVGIDVDLLKAIAHDQGFKYELRAIGFNDAVEALEKGLVDGVIAGMSITDERQRKFDFSEPYFDGGIVMGIHSDNEEIKGYRDLADQKVAVKKGTEGQAFAESIQEKYGFEIAVFEESDEMYLDVMHGNSAACFEDYPVMGYGISQGVSLKMVTNKEQGGSYGFAVGKEQNKELLEMFNEGLADLKENGKYQEILDIYIRE